MPFAYDRQAISGTEGRPPLAPGKAVKFLAEDPSTGNRSSVWRIWTAPKTDDVYICETKTGGLFKASLHNEWGKWRIAMTKEEADAQGVQRPVLSERPRSAPVEGWSEGTAILIPCADLRASSETIRSDVIRIPTSPKHSAMTIRLLMDEQGVTSQQVVGDAFGLAVIRARHRRCDLRGLCTWLAYLGGA